jgi:hypothetical protein
MCELLHIPGNLFSSAWAGGGAMPSRSIWMLVEPVFEGETHDLGALRLGRSVSDQRESRGRMTAQSLITSPRPRQEQQRNRPIPLFYSGEVFGDTTSARLQALAEPETVVIAAGTRRLVGDVLPLLREIRLTRRVISGRRAA